MPTKSLPPQPAIEARQMETLTRLGPSATGDDTGEPDDRTLLDGFLGDDEASFPAIYRRYQEQLTAYARNHLNRALAHEAEDVTQEAFADLFRRRHELLPETSLRGLLHRVVEHKCAFRLRHASAQKRDFHQTLPLRDSPSCSTERDDELVDWRTDPGRHENHLDLETMLATLPPNEAQTIRLVLLEKHTEPEAAEIMGVPLTTIKWWIKDGRDRLKRLGGPDGE